MIQQHGDSNDNDRCLLRSMQQQIEYYFSADNLTRDIFLQQVLTAHNGCAPVHVIAHFPKLQQLYEQHKAQKHGEEDYAEQPIQDLMCRALQGSDLVSVSNDGCYLHPRHHDLYWGGSSSPPPLINDNTSPYYYQPHNDNAIVPAPATSITATDGGASTGTPTLTTVSPTSFATTASESSTCSVSHRNSKKNVEGNYNGEHFYNNGAPSPPMQHPYFVPVYNPYMQQPQPMMMTMENAAPLMTQYPQHHPNAYNPLTYGPAVPSPAFTTYLPPSYVQPPPPIFYTPPYHNCNMPIMQQGMVADLTPPLYYALPRAEGLPIQEDSLQCPPPTQTSGAGLGKKKNPPFSNNSNNHSGDRSNTVRGGGRCLPENVYVQHSQFQQENIKEQITMDQGNDKSNESSKHCRKSRREQHNSSQQKRKGRNHQKTKIREAAAQRERGQILKEEQFPSLTTTNKPAGSESLPFENENVHNESKRKNHPKKYAEALLQKVPTEEAKDIATMKESVEAEDKIDKTAKGDASGANVGPLENQMAEMIVSEKRG